jgi:hypothetical protein
MSVGLRPLVAHCPAPWSSGGIILTEKTERIGEKCVTLSATDPTWTAQVANPGLWGEKPSTNRLTCGTNIQSVPQREHHTSPLQRSTG